MFVIEYIPKDLILYLKPYITSHITYLSLSLTCKHFLKFYEKINFTKEKKLFEELCKGGYYKFLDKFQFPEFYLSFAKFGLDDLLKPYILEKNKGVLLMLKASKYNKFESMKFIYQQLNSADIQPDIFDGWLYGFSKNSIIVKNEEMLKWLLSTLKFYERDKIIEQIMSFGDINLFEYFISEFCSGYTIRSQKTIVWLIKNAKSVEIFIKYVPIEYLCDEKYCYCASREGKLDILRYLTDECNCKLNPSIYLIAKSSNKKNITDWFETTNYYKTEKDEINSKCGMAPISRRIQF